MNDLKDAYPEMYLATAQDRIRKIELGRRRAQWRLERQESRGRRRFAWRPGTGAAPSRG